MFIVMALAITAAALIALRFSQVVTSREEVGVQEVFISSLAVLQG
jgi:hypothetical protein